MHSRISQARIAVYLAGASALALTAVTPALAQQVETVTVTAERHIENEQDVPISTSTLNSEEVSSIFESGQDIKAIANHVPGLFAESSNGRLAPRFYIRGLGNTDFDLAASQPVSIIMDDVVMENTILKSSPVYDIDDIEVDRGPQGTLFGRNTTAGLVKFTTRKPTQEMDGYLTGSYGEFGTANVEGAFGDGITDTLSFRVSGLFQHRDEYVDNAFLHTQNVMGGYDERAARVQLAWNPDDQFSALLNLHGRSLDGTSALFRANIFTKGSNQLNGNYQDSTVYYDAGANNPQRYDGLGGGLTMNYKVADMVLTSITGYETTHGYSRGDIDGGHGNPFASPPVPYGPGPDFLTPSESQDGLDYLRQFTQEIHLASDYKDSPLFWQVGAFYFDTKYQDTTFPYFVPPTSVAQSNDSYAVFGQASYKITPDFTLTGGVRWTSDIKGMSASGFGAAPLLKLNGDNVSWDVSADYKVDDQVNVYARVASGFRAPSIQGRNLAFGAPATTARSETIISYEAGVKTMLFNDTLRLNADGYDYFIHDMQFTAIGGAGNFTSLVNAKGGLAYGLEGEADWAATENLSFNLGASWTHSEIHDPNLFATPCGAVTGQAEATLFCTPLNAPYDVMNAKVPINGNPFPQAPEYILTFTAKYTYPLEDGGSLFAFTNWWLQGYTNFLLYKSAEFYSNGNYEGDLRLGYNFPGGKYDIALYAQNITDKKNVQGAIDFSNLTGYVGDPRVIGVILDAHL